MGVVDPDEPLSDEEIDDVQGGLGIADLGGLPDPIRGQQPDAPSDNAFFMSENG